MAGLVITQSFTAGVGATLSLAIRARLFPLEPGEEEQPDFVAVSVTKNGDANFSFFDTATGRNATLYATRLYDGVYVATASDKYGEIATQTVYVSNGFAEPVESNAFRVESVLEVDVVERGTATGRGAVRVVTVSGRPFTALRVEAHLGDFVWSPLLPEMGWGTAFRRVDFPDLRAASYRVYMRAVGLDANGAEQVLAILEHGLTIDEPEAPTAPLEPVVAKPYLSVSLLNSIRFVETTDGDTLPTMDNRLYCEEGWQGITRPPYYQKVARPDNIVTQFRSNYTAHQIRLLNYETGGFVKFLPAVLRAQNTGLQQQFAAWITAHPQDETQARVYFNGGQLPFDFVAGNALEVLNATPISLNGGVAITAVEFDEADTIPYVLIAKPYPITTPPTARINCEVVTQYDKLPYNVYEFTLDWEGVDNGVYTLQLTATAPDNESFGEPEYKSEPIALLPEHPGTHLINWRNLDDAHGLSFGTGLICGLRVESDFFQRDPYATRKNHRAPDGKLMRISSTLIRRVKLNLHRLPPWLHEKLAFAFELDYVAVNRIQYQSEDGYDMGGYTARYALSNAAITLEQVTPFTDQNGTDLGDITGLGDGFIAVNGQYLKS